VLNNVAGAQISEETRQRVLLTAKRLGYVPNAAAQALASKRSRSIALVIVRRPYQVATDSFLTQMLNGMVSAVQTYQLRLLIDIIEPEHQEKAYLELARANRVDGLILAGPSNDDAALQTLVEHNFPTVLIGELPDAPFASIDVDNRAAVAKAVAHLIRLGHRRIAFITNAPISYGAARERLLGYKDALELAGLAFDEYLVRYGDFDPESGYRQMKSLLTISPRPDSVFIASDVVAIGALAAMHDVGLRIPEDIAVVGYDDILIAPYLHPPLTTVHLPAGELGFSAVEMLVQLIRQENLEMLHVRHETHLVIRASCGANTIN
jgi:LacI family transcriptional regulator